MTERKKVVCEQADDTCRGRVRRVVDPYQQEVYGETVKMLLCVKHEQDRADDV